MWVRVPSVTPEITMFIFPDSFRKEDLIQYVTRIKDHYSLCVKNNPESWEKWQSRIVDISEDPIIDKVIKILESKLKVRLVCHQAQIQIWPENVNLKFHKHSDDETGRKLTSEYNSMLYLNDSFKGGEFVTEQGIKIEPRTGTLTFFDGNNIKHGVNHFYGDDRYTIIFWWSKDSQCF
jgi:hypothetical protein